MDKSLSETILRYLKRTTGHFSSHSDLVSYLERNRQEKSTRQHPFTVEEIGLALNMLMQHSRIEASNEESKGIVYHYIDEQSASITSKMTFLEKSIYRIVKAAGDKGVDSISIRQEVNQ